MAHQMRSEDELRDQLDSAIKTDYGYNEEYNEHHDWPHFESDRAALHAMLAPILDVLLDIRRLLADKETSDG